MVTLKGEQVVAVTVVHCKDHPYVCFHWYDPADVLLISGCRADLNVVVLIGLLKWCLGMKRCEIRIFLLGKNIFLSMGVISNRSLDFLLLFKQFHMVNNDKLRALFDLWKAVVLHVDGTFRSGGKVVYVLQDDFSEIVAVASLIPSEAEEYVSPVLLEFKEMYGSPFVVVRDMSEGVASSISTVFPDASQQICQVHFVRNFEKDLISDLHKTLKSLIVRHGFTSNLKVLRGDGTVIDDIKSLQRRWVHVIVDYLIFPLGGRVKWLSRSISYYVQYRRIREVAALVRRIVLCNTDHNFICREIMELNKCLRSIVEDSNITRSGYLMQRTMEWLDDLRVHLRITREKNLKDFPSENISLEDCKTKIRKKLNEILQEGKELGGKYEQIALKINKKFERHWNELFIPNPLIDGEMITFRRQNNCLESSHRRIRKAIRERTGKGETNREMEQFGDLIAILSNLWNKTYQKEVLSEVENLSVSLSPFVKDLPDLRKEYRRVRAGPEIPIRDDKRLGILQEFVEILESGKSYDELLSPLKKILNVNNI